MATKTVRVDDIDNSSEATHVVVITLDGVKHTLDLNDEHTAELKAAVEPWIKAAAAKAVKPKAAKVAVVKSEPTMPDGTAIDKEAVKAWAKANGIKVGDFFVNPKVADAYIAAHSGEPTLDDALAEPEPGV